MQRRTFIGGLLGLVGLARVAKAETPKPKCTLCNDTGVVHRARSVVPGHPEMTLRDVRSECPCRMTEVVIRLPRDAKIEEFKVGGIGPETFEVIRRQHEASEETQAQMWSKFMGDYKKAMADRRERFNVVAPAPQLP